MTEFPPLILEPLKISHAEVMFAGLNDPELYTYIDDTPPDSLLELRKIYQRRALGCSPDGHQLWLNWMIFAPTMKQYLGYVQATIYKDSHQAQIAYVVFKKFWCMGIGKRSVEMMIDRLKLDHGIQELRSTVDINNQASIALMRKLNFLPIDNTTMGDIIFAASIENGRSSV